MNSLTLEIPRNSGPFTSDGTTPTPIGAFEEDRQEFERDRWKFEKDRQEFERHRWESERGQWSNSQGPNHDNMKQSTKWVTRDFAGSQDTDFESERQAFERDRWAFERDRWAFERKRWEHECEQWKQEYEESIFARHTGKRATILSFLCLLSGLLPLYFSSSKSRLAKVVMLKT
ncbi:predicted protein [Postia placenta Mad-698-R]|nr:predicted protein [Postia placenta Mad-698-R]